jgi:hypothetical protein
LQQLSWPCDGSSTIGARPKLHNLPRGAEPEKIETVCPPGIRHGASHEDTRQTGIRISSLSCQSRRPRASSKEKSGPNSVRHKNLERQPALDLLGIPSPSASEKFASLTTVANRIVFVHAWQRRLTFPVCALNQNSAVWVKMSYAESWMGESDESHENEFHVSL